MSTHPDDIPADDLPCRELVELVTEHQEGALDSRTEQRVLLHLTQCPACEDYVAQMRTTAQLASKLRDDEVRHDLRQSLLAAFRARR